MDLDDSSRYALGALFCLALHSDELRAGAEALHQTATAWGQHDKAVVVVTEESDEEQQSKMASLWDQYWGYDLARASGLLERVLTKLGIPETSWDGLKVLPEVAQKAGYGPLVQQYRGILDATMQSERPPEIISDPPLNASASATDGLEAAVEEDDEDLAADIKRAKLKAPRNTSPKSHVSEVNNQTQDAAAVSKGGQAEEGQHQAGDTDTGMTDLLQAGLSLKDDSKSASQLAGQSRRGPGEPAAAAFQAATELLEACIASLDQPNLEGIVKADKEKGKAAKVEGVREQPGAEKAVNVRWYDARAREALQAVATWLQVPWSKMLLYECLLAQQSQAPEMQGDGQKKLSPKERRVRALKIGAAAAGGGALLAITGGLAAPALAAVAGTVMTTVGGSAAAAGAVTGIMGSTVGAAAMIAGFGAGGAHVVGGKMARRIGDVKEFGFRIIPEDGNFQCSYSAHVPSTEEGHIPDKEAQGDAPGPKFHAASSQHPQEEKREDSETGKEQGGPSQSSSWFGGGSNKGSSWIPWRKSPDPEAVPLLPIPVSPKPRPDPKLSRTIAVAGIVAQPDDFIDLWRGLSAEGSERFTLVWETQELMALNSSIMDMLLSQAYREAGKYMIEKFVIHGLVGAVALPLTVLNVSGIIDSSWAIVMNRAARAGELLAHLLMSGAHGDCPVTLVGHSMGARLIFYCLLELCRCKCKGIVQQAVMLGAPVDIVPERWSMARSVVAGRCINGYSREDWVLALSFRARQGTFRPAAGLGPVPVAGIENLDLTKTVHGHGDYLKCMNDVLAQVDLGHPEGQKDRV